MSVDELARLSLRPVMQTPLNRSLERLDALVSPLTGIVASVGDIMRMADDARPAKVSCLVADQRPLVGTELDSRPGGSNPDPGAARAAAIGEALERYAGSFVPVERIRLGTARDLDLAVDAESFALFSNEQYGQPGFPFVPFTNTTPVRWIDGLTLPSGEPALLPVQLVFMRFGIAEELGEERIGYTTSNGLACGPTPEEAILAALLELLERDAFVVVWENRLSLPLLDWEEDAQLRRQHERYFAPSGLAVHAVDLSAFWDVPTVLGVVRNHGEGAVLGVGAAAAATVREAWRAAVTEAFAVRSWARTELFEKPPRAFEHDFANVTDFADHVAYHGDRAHTGVAAFLDRSASRRPVHDVESLPAGSVLDTIAALCDRLASHDLRAYAVDVTTADLRQAGLHVFKAVVPELCALSAVHAARFLGGSRLYRAAHEAGLRERPLASHELNSFPHPFP